MSPRFALKAATNDIHRELDGVLSRLDLADPSDYRRFLQFQGRTVPAIEGALASGGLGELVDGWCVSRRSGALKSDLTAMGERMPAAIAAPTIEGTADLLGMGYVLEGSRLGARALRERVGEGLPSSFLGDEAGYAAWPNMVAAIDGHLCCDASLTVAKDAARRCFALFLEVAREDGIS